jgi:hypothetical protein
VHLPFPNALLPQPLVLTFSCLLHLPWASLGCIIQLSGRLSVLWLAGNLAISLFLAHLHSHLTLSSISLSPVILRLCDLSTKSIEGLTYIRSAHESSGKSVLRSTPLGLPPSFADPALLPPGAFNAFPTSIDI